MEILGKKQMIKNYIQKQIETGIIKEGMRLPSCREMANIMATNKITVNNAYKELELEHKVYSIPRGGFYLIDTKEGKENKNRVIDFSKVKPYHKLIPHRQFSHAMNQAIDLHKNCLFNYESTIGLESLRGTVKKVFEANGIYTTVDKIMITHGAQQAISLVFQTIFKEKKGKLLVEVPTYSLALDLAYQYGIEMIGIERKEEGLDLSQLENLFKSGDIAAFYVIPRHHNPTGYSLSEYDKKKISENSNQYNIYVIEDDYLADLGEKRSSMPIHYYDINKKVIYIRSSSKTFMPGIRLGAAVLPQDMIETVTKLKYLSDLNTSRLLQAALDIFIKSGMYDRQVKMVRNSYNMKLKKIREIISSMESNIFFHVPEYGMFIWVELPEYVDAIALENKLYGLGIIVKTADEFFLMKQKDLEKRYLRLCIAGVSEEDINKISTIIRFIHEDKL